MRTKTWWAELPNETLMESAWERQMSLTGFEEYEQSRYKANGDLTEASETKAGQKLIRQMIGTASKAIEVMQEDVLHRHRAERTLKGTVLMVPADTSALLTIKALLNGTFSAKEADRGINYQVVCKDAAKAIELELNFRNWIKKSRENAKAYAQAKGLDKAPKSRAEKLIEERGMNRMNIMRWKRAFEELSEYKWDTLEAHYCGEAMVKTVVEALPEHFQIITERMGAKETRHVVMTEATRQKMIEIEAKAAALSVVKKPMLTRPRKWTKEDQC